MKRKSIEKVLAVVMAASVAITPMSSVAFAAEEGEVPANTITQEVQASEPAKVQVEEKQAPAASESEAPAAAESAAPAAEQQAAPQAEAAAPAAEQQAAAPKAAKSNYTVKIVLKGVMTESGETDVEGTTVSVSAKGSKTISATTINRWITSKKVHYNGATYKYESKLTDASGNAVTSISIKGKDLDDDTTLTFRPVYTKVDDISVVVNFNHIMLTNGEETSSTINTILESGNGWSFTKKKLDNLVKATKFSYKGVNYTYSGKWVDEEGNEFSSLSVTNDGKTGNVEYNIRPLYEKTYPEVLDFRYIDNISTGSGSWTNTDGAFDTYTHKFKEPEGQKHYKFVEWKDFDNETSYQKTGTFEYKAKSAVDENTPPTSFSIYAVWQPSVTVEYYSNGVLVNSVESTDSALEAYDYNAADTEEVENGADFNGWFESAEEGAARVEEGTAYDLPELTTVPTEQKIVKLYAKYTVDYTVEHYTENLNGSFKLAETEVKGAALGSDVSAEAKEFAGFTFNKEIEGTLTEAKAAKGLTLKLYYNRNAQNAADEVIPAAPVKPSDKVVSVAEANTPAANAQTQQINANAVPQAAAPTVINDNETPLAQTGAWALINLICAAATALLSLIMMAVYFGKKRNEDEQIEDEHISRARIASMIPAIGAIIAFILTENMSLPMAMVDKWTVLMIAILAIQAGVGLFAKLRDNEENEQEEEFRA